MYKVCTPMKQTIPMVLSTVVACMQSVPVLGDECEEGWWGTDQV